MHDRTDKETTDTPVSNVFLSYAREDRAFVLPFVRVLESRGYTAWWDRSIEAGAAFRDRIEAEIDRADWVIVLWSRASVRSEWVIDEATRAHERGILIPAELDDSRPPLGFGRFNNVDLRNWNGDAQHPGFRAIEARLRQADVPVPVAEDEAAATGSGAMVQHGMHENDAELAPVSARRPKLWHCVYCGRKSPAYNDYHCVHCESLRPFFPSTATMKECSACGEFNLLAAIFCEWCGSRLPLPE